ncbi:hypothetical protein HPY28_23525 [Brevibacillus sp. HB1.2]|uniref:hypothetical protein n=1 Tax=Brevibacillus TaxID=55080 RepID=UPI000D0EC2F7|nr:MULTISPECIES: hypothetical protein [Brevibacillus]MBG9943537.1 hypothetical protein [Brevibacillus formosus]MBW5467848.1 hypothetical protein [Brevibacillus formosus]MED1948079.1 hypothetical protein [Brevibacillus formosus]MED1998190.1 hypothetical protein [Brevibacillus formosus]MED2080731.1 hypothetical protein [Brevibacillus formosus]
MSSYEEIKDSVNLGFEEYVINNKYNTAQASARILEEDWWILNEDNFSKTAFFICLALESLKMNEIADFILLKLDTFLGNLEFEDSTKINDVNQLLHDISLYKERIETDDYKIIETNNTWKGRLEYILSLKREDL